MLLRRSYVSAEVFWCGEGVVCVLRPVLHVLALLKPHNNGYSLTQAAQKDSIRKSTVAKTYGYVLYGA